jgi:hypothetical protein
MSGDATGRERRHHLDLGRLPQVEWVRFARIRYDEPREIALGAKVVRLDEAGEVEVQFAEDPPIRALAPAVWVGDVMLTESTRVDEGRYRFVAPFPDALERGAPVAVGWAGGANPRPEKTVSRFDGFDEDPTPGVAAGAS